MSELVAVPRYSSLKPAARRAVRLRDVQRAMAQSNPAPRIRSAPTPAPQRVENGTRVIGGGGTVHGAGSAPGTRVVVGGRGGWWPGWGGWGWGNGWAGWGYPWAAYPTYTAPYYPGYLWPGWSAGPGYGYNYYGPGIGWR